MESGQVRSGAELTEEQLEILRGRLQHLRAELRNRIASERVPRETEKEVEPLDAAEQTREQDDAISFAERDRVQLVEVEHALSKMANGTYGISEVSGDPIPFERLRAVPWARRHSDEDDS